MMPSMDPNEPAADHEKHLRSAILLCRAARDRGDHPFGAVLSLDGIEVARADNTVVTQRDPTGHAEMNLLRSIAGAFSQDELARAVLYASTEPCAMCSGGIYWAGIGRVVYGCSVEAFGALVGGSLAIPCREVFARGVRAVEVLGPLLEEEAVEVHRGFWR
jgi:tRNA(Arg) A34 adenosine deaminase TadA